MTISLFLTKKIIIKGLPCFYLLPTVFFSLGVLTQPEKHRKGQIEPICLEEVKLLQRD